MRASLRGCSEAVNRLTTSPAVARPRDQRLRAAVRQPSPPAPVGIHDVDLVATAAAAHERDRPSVGRPRERLPPAKDLAAVLGVNTNTVLRSLRLLRDEGLLEFRPRRGLQVRGTPERVYVVQRARELVEFARSQGYRLDELVEIIEGVG